LSRLGTGDTCNPEPPPSVKRTIKKPKKSLLFSVARDQEREGQQRCPIEPQFSLHT
jgi:hypothetical protein